MTNTVFGDRDCTRFASTGGLVMAVMAGSLGVTVMVAASFQSPVVEMVPPYPAASTTRYTPAGTFVKVNCPFASVVTTTPSPVKLPIAF